MSGCSSRGFFGPAAIAALGFLLCVVLAFFVSYLLSETRFRNDVLSTWLVLTSIAVPFFILDLVAGFFLIKPLSPALRPESEPASLDGAELRYSRIEQSSSRTSSASTTSACAARMRRWPSPPTRSASSCSAIRSRDGERGSRRRDVVGAHRAGAEREDRRLRRAAPSRCSTAASTATRRSSR